MITGDGNVPKQGRDKQNGVDLAVDSGFDPRLALMERKGIKRLLECEWYGNTNMVRLFLHLLLKAKEEDGVDVKRGELLTCVPRLSAETGLTPKQVRTALEGLEEGRMLGRMRAGKMTIITICEYDSYNVSETDRGQDEGTIEGRMRAGIKEKKEELPPAPPLEETKENSSKNKKKILSKDNIKEKEESFVEPEFEPAFSLWLEYKHQRRESYKSDISLKTCYNKLVRLSGNNPDTAMAIVEQSMANNWAGLFSLKDDNGNGNYKQQKNGSTGQLPGEAQRANPLAGYDKIID